MDGQQRVEVQGDLNNALTQPQNQQQLNNVAVNSTLPTEPATVAPVRNGNASRDTAKMQTAERPTTTRPARQQTVIEPKKPQATVKTEPKPVAQQPKHTEPAAPVVSTGAPAATSTPVATPAPKATASTEPAQTASPAQTTATPAAGAKTTGNVGSLKSAPSSHYTLQLSSSSNYDNLNGWAKKENLKNYVVYETTRNGQPWYVLGFWRVRFERRSEKSGIYIASRCSGQKPVGETAASGTGRFEVIKAISRNGLPLRELPEALDAVGAFSTAGEGVIS